MSEAFIVRHGGAHSPKKLWIVNNGAVSAEAGSFLALSNEPGRVKYDLRYSPDSISMEVFRRSDGSSAAYFFPGEPIDATPYSTMYVELSLESPIAASIGLKKDRDWGNEAASATTNAMINRRTVSLDISGVNSLMYPFVFVQGQGVNSGNTAYVFNMWFER